MSLVAGAERRAELADRVLAALMDDRRVSVVEPFGSLAGGKSDEFTVIDVLVHLRPGVVDRQFWEDLPEVLRAVGPAVHGWSFQALAAGQYGASFLFDDYPLFWAVDVGIVSDRPTDPSDLISTYRWEQIYKVWLGAAKAVARSKKRLDDVRRLVEKHQPVATTPESDTAIEDLRKLLAAIERRKRDLGDPYQDLHERCRELVDLLSEM
jgi:hypothetical protein